MAFKITLSVVFGEDREGSSPCIKGQSFSVRYVVPLSLHQNGLSIGPSAAFGTCGGAKPADTSLNILSARDLADAS